MDNSWGFYDKTKGHLILVDQKSLSSLLRQSSVVRRVQARHSVSSTCVDFTPDNFQQMAGLVCYYNTTHFYYLHISGGDFGTKSRAKFLNIICHDKHKSYEAISPVPIDIDKPVYLKVEFKKAEIQFYYAVEKDTWIKVGPVLDGSILSDDYVQESEQGYRSCFTGAFVGMACKDLSEQRKPAHFSFFNYD